MSIYTYNLVDNVHAPVMHHGFSLGDVSALSAIHTASPTLLIMRPPMCVPRGLPHNVPESVRLKVCVFLGSESCGEWSHFRA